MIEVWYSIYKKKDNTFLEHRIILDEEADTFIKDFEGEDDFLFCLLITAQINDLLLHDDILDEYAYDIYESSKFDYILENNIIELSSIKCLTNLPNLSFY